MRRLRRLWSAVLLIALLSVPLALRAHHHGTHQKAPSCAACAVASAPVRLVSGLVLPAAVVWSSALSPLRLAAPARVDAPLHFGRAPPSLPHISVG